ncbi:MAG: ADP-ribosylglycohydrolase family protein [candidate division NC10 bacterium]|nr:ADP-ribosylglycohydrolase family protein [candidate division NC10 bacterium]
MAAPEDLKRTLFTVVDAGHDADRPAVIACTLAGASHGYSRLPRRLVDALA